MSLNKELMGLYNKETGKQATYISGVTTFHFLSYVDWLETRLLKSSKVANDSATTNALSLKLPNYEEVVNKLEIKYNARKWSTDEWKTVRKTYDIIVGNNKR